MEALSLGVNFKIPPKNVDRIHVETQFENLLDQLSKLTPTTKEQHNWLKVKLVDIANGYMVAPIHQTCCIDKSHIKALRDLKARDILVLKPDKGTGVVIMNKLDYKNKMYEILGDESKFQEDQSETTVTQIEKRVTNQLKLLLQHGMITEAMYNSLKPRGTRIPQMYGLPKIHKANTPLRPVLSMCNSPYHKLARWLVDLLTPVRRMMTKYTVKDTFDLIDCVQNMNIADKVMCSMDVQSLFTNIPLRETVDFLCEFIMSNKVVLPIPVEYLRDLLLLCTENVHFLFEDKPYRQVDGVAMGSPLGPVLADIFMTMVEMKCEQHINQMCLYKRYVDDTLVIAPSGDAVLSFLNVLDNTHPNARFTCELEDNNCLPFLDVLLTRREDGSIKRSVHRKATWTGLYEHFNSFAPIQYKRCLVKTLFNRARRICTDDCLESELLFITQTLRANGYPEAFIRFHGQLKENRPTVLTVPKLSVYLQLPFKGDIVAAQLESRVHTAIRRAFNAAKFCPIWETRKLPMPPVKPTQPISATTHCIYQFVCNCGSSYIGRTDRSLGKRIGEHIPKWIAKLSTQEAGEREKVSKMPASSIAKHLLESGHQVDPRSTFTVIYRNDNPKVLRFAEAVALNRHRPILCVQKQLTVSLKLPWGS
ncbi:unnamed protein product [Dicrocoelium dendriticum]|nr:unnamed protein product [Dicrocoelium dendriticum]